MKKYNFRFVHDPENQNIGLTTDEINVFQKELNLKFPEAYILYLQTAGKNSNVFPVEGNPEKLKRIQEELTAELEQLELPENKNVFCLRKDNYYCNYFQRTFESYLFFNLYEDAKNPKLYLLDEICINEGWNAFQKQVTEKDDFVSFINHKTGEKYGISMGQYIKNIPIYIISLPITIAVLTILAFQVIKEKIVNK
ncbi:hypothetical protein [uncultured Chryseobacterium sp.]|uniref:hypothetical protein n=1 Tax=uncultured Chryseobacterium sp. TaxID=259322 RepID=UPI0025F67EB0|nr:hypothetical protein [uncultured Chryseobacterium sp.]